MMSANLMSVKEMAGVLGCSPKSVYAMVSEDTIPYIRVGVGRGTLRFDPDEVIASLKRKEPTLVPLERRHGKRHLA